MVKSTFCYWHIPYKQTGFSDTLFLKNNIFISLIDITYILGNNIIPQFLLRHLKFSIYITGYIIKFMELKNKKAQRRKLKSPVLPSPKTTTDSLIDTCPFSKFV